MKTNNRLLKIPVQQRVKRQLHHHQNVANVKQQQLLAMLYKRVINQLQQQVNKLKSFIIQNKSAFFLLLTDVGDEPKGEDAAAVASDDNDADEGKSNKKTPSPRKGGRASNAGKKRAASSSPAPASASKKTKATPKGKQSVTSTEEQKMDVDNTEANNPPAPVSTSESEPVQTPPKKARTSGTKKTPTSASTTPEASGEYARKLRPRK